VVPVWKSRSSCSLPEGMLLAVRIPLISGRDRLVARLFRV
jgi:hypothetical protein